MSDPYNSYPSHLPPPSAPRVVQGPDLHVSTPRRNVPDPIARLDVSDTWKRRFRAIERAGGPDLPHIRDLDFAERWRITSNFPAFIFWPIYLPLKGLWRQAAVILAIAIAVGFLMELAGLGRFGRAVGYGASALAMLRVNVGYYRKVVLGETRWW